MGAYEVDLRALTPVWTGGVDQQKMDRVHETGLIGSLRWWYEVLVRGLGGQACDPAEKNDRCTSADGGYCAACELFGCTGQARKFRLRVLDRQGELISGRLERGTDLRLQFVEMRALLEQEKWLLAKAVELAARYGALGGRTARKPQARPGVGDDYGILELQSSFPVFSNRSEIERYLRSNAHRKVETRLPDLRWFFFVRDGFLWRRQVNRLIGLSDDGRREIGHEDFQKFLRGRAAQGTAEAISKKIFSFRVAGGRIWGYAGDANMREEVIKRIRQELGSGKYTVKTGEEVLREL